MTVVANRLRNDMCGKRQAEAIPAMVSGYAAIRQEVSAGDEAAVSVGALMMGARQPIYAGCADHKPASIITLAAASAACRRRSASRTCLPELTRRAIAWPIEPASITTMTLLTAALPSRDKPRKRRRDRSATAGTGIRKGAKC
jgi:hypothetical protein